MSTADASNTAAHNRSSTILKAIMAFDVIPGRYLPGCTAPVSSCFCVVFPPLSSGECSFPIVDSISLICFTVSLRRASFFMPSSILFLVPISSPIFTRRCSCASSRRSPAFISDSSCSSFSFSLCLSASALYSVSSLFSSDCSLSSGWVLDLSVPTLFLTALVSTASAL